MNAFIISIIVTVGLLLGNYKWIEKRYKFDVFFKEKAKGREC